MSPLFDALFGRRATGRNPARRTGSNLLVAPTERARLDARGPADTVKQGRGQATLHPGEPEPTTMDPQSATPPAEPIRVPAATCPHCHRSEGFLIDIGGAAYRVLEDPRDTDLLNDLTPDDLQDIGRAECVACNQKTDATALLLPAIEALRAPQQVTIGTGQTRNRLHFAGKAALRIDDDGTSYWPACPDCGATHDFLLDLEGVAYHVLEDDNDTELLRDGEAKNLMCSRCSAVFDL